MSKTWQHKWLVRVEVARTQTRSKEARVFDTRDLACEWMDIQLDDPQLRSLVLERVVHVQRVKKTRVH